MPRYEYVCNSCGHGFELRQSFDSEPVAECPVCQNGARRRISAVPIVFKGSGWYVNDYGKGRSNNTTTKDSDSKADDKPAKTESKKEPAPATSGSKSDSKSSSTKPKGD